jgi:hypothetical protein
VPKGKLLLCLGNTAAFELIDQDKLKLTLINKLTKPLNLKNKPPKDGSYGKIAGHGFHGLSSS